MENPQYFMPDSQIGMPMGVGDFPSMGADFSQPNWNQMDPSYGHENYPSHPGYDFQTPDIQEPPNQHFQQDFIPNQDMSNFQEIPPNAEVVMNHLLNNREHEIYSNLWRLEMASKAGPGEETMSGTVAAGLLRRSGLTDDLLHQVWSLADPADSGEFTFDAFCIACRLVAHVQNGLGLSLEAIGMEPITLPNFQIISLDGGPQMNLGGDNLWPSTSDPFVAEVGDLAAESPQMNSMRSSGMVEFPTPPTSQELPWMEQQIVGGSTMTSPWHVSSKELQKYGQLFEQTDTNCDGFVEGYEGFELLNRSELPPDDLQHIWDLADLDVDGRLNAKEFIIAVHLVSKAKKGIPLPPFCPPDLDDAVSNALNSGTPRAQDMAFPADDTIVPPLPDFSPNQKSGKKEKKSKGTSNKVSDAFEPKLHPEKSLSSQFPENIGDWPTADTTPGSGTVSEKPAEDLFADNFFDEKFQDNELPAKAEKTGKKKKREDRSKSPPPADAFDPVSMEKKIRTEIDRINSGLQVSDSVNILQGLVDSQKKMTTAITEGNQLIFNQLSCLGGACDSIRMDLETHSKTLAEQIRRRNEYEDQIKTLQQTYDDLRKQKHEIDVEYMTSCRYAAHFEEEISFLENLVNDTQQEILTINNNYEALSIEMKKKDQQTRLLSAARTNVVNDIKADKVLLSNEERQVAELRNTLERLDREKQESQSRLASMREAERQTDQDKQLQLAAVENERANLLSIRQQRVATANLKLGLFSDVAESTENGWLLQHQTQVRGSDRESKIINKKLPAAYASTDNRLQPRRDPKGILTGPPLAAPAASLSFKQSIHDPNRFHSTGLNSQSGYRTSPPHWHSFGNTNKMKDPRDGTINDMFRSKERLNLKSEIQENSSTIGDKFTTDDLLKLAATEVGQASSNTKFDDSFTKTNNSHDKRTKNRFPSEMQTDGELFKNEFSTNFDFETPSFGM